MLELSMPAEAAARRTRLLADPELRAELVRYVRGRVAGADAEDVVQATLAEAVAGGAPDEPEALRRWLFAVARNKAVDWHRRARREAPLEPDHDAAAPGHDPAAADLLRWAERELPDREQAPATLEWLLREGAGEKLEEIASEERVPAPRVRQRVARLRKHFRERWATQLTAALLLGALLVAGGVYFRARTTPEEPLIHREPELDPERRGRELRRAALERCARSEWQPCLDGLDAARALDPAGDAAAEVRSARERAAAELAPPAPVAPAPTEEPPAPAPKTLPVPKHRPAPKKPPAPAPEQSNALPSKGEDRPTKGVPGKRPAPVEQKLELRK